MNFAQRWRLVTQQWELPIRQVREEAAALYALVADLRPSAMLEVGSAWGGTLALYAGACAPGARLVSVDNGREAPTLTWTAARLRGEGFPCDLIVGNSHSLDTRGQVALAIGVPDFVHIDGDHSAQGVLRDWRDYGRMARIGAIVAFHDIVPRSPNWGVGIAWPQIRQQAAAYVEIVGRTLPPSNAPAGIGVIWT